MIFLYLLSMLLILSALGENKNCDYIKCSKVYDFVCGMATTVFGVKITMRYHNICFMWKKECEEESIIEITQVSDKYCGEEEGTEVSLESYSGRRLIDHGIVGGQQACNHSCPTYCTDAYEPACAQIWVRKPGMSFTFRPMINHCHVDMFSCSTGLNVTIQGLNKCYKSGMALVFMLQVAQLKSLHLLDEDPFGPTHPSRRAAQIEDDALKAQLFEVVRRIFDKYRNP